MNEQRLPPRNESAERAALGSVLRWQPALHDVCEVVTPEDFYLAGHQAVLKAALRLADAGKPVDVVTVADELRRAGELENAGGPAYLGELLDAAPTGANAGWYARLVRDASVRRRLIHAATEILRDAHDGAAAPEALVEAAEQKVFAIAEAAAGSTPAVPLRKAVEEGVSRVEAAAQGEIVEGGLETGFLDLDRLLRLRNGELTILAARPGNGKTALGGALFRHAVLNGSAALFVSLEMSRVELTERFLAAEAGIDTRRLRDGRLSEGQWERLAAARRSLDCPRSHIDDEPSQRMFRIAAAARRLKLRHGISLVVIDYLQLIQPESERVPRHEQVAGISRRLKLLARELSLPVVVLAQLNRASEDRAGQRPRLSDLRESGALEQDADAVVLIHKETPDARSVEVIVAKQRNGPTGGFNLTWRPECVRFDNFAAEPDIVFEH